MTDAREISALRDAWRCPHSPNGYHIVDTSMESGPNSCFHCEARMPREPLTSAVRAALRERA